MSLRTSFYILVDDHIGINFPPHIQELLDHCEDAKTINFNQILQNVEENTSNYSVKDLKEKFTVTETLYKRLEKKLNKLNNKVAKVILVISQENTKKLEIRKILDRFKFQAFAEALGPKKHQRRGTA